MNLNVVILAAGKGSRMYSDLPKVLHKLGGKSLLERVIIAAKKLHPQKIYVVCSEELQVFSDQFKSHDLVWVKQRHRIGTGDAVKQVLPYLAKSSRVLVLYADVPLITTATLQKLIKKSAISKLAILTTKLDDPTGFGRIIRDQHGAVSQIIEERDATISERKIKEINSGILVTDQEILAKYLSRLKRGNKQREYYLTDLVKMLVKDGKGVASLMVNNSDEVSGVNSKYQLMELERKYQRKQADKFATDGLILMDPARFDLRGDLKFGCDVMIDINVVMEGKVELGDNTSIEPNNCLKNTKIGKNVIIRSNCVIDGAIIGDNCVVGPFARVRPGTILASGAKIGNFVELKNSQIGRDSKASHLSYIGDSVVGNQVNIGAGTITCNYDGFAKYRTIIDDGSFIGSNTSLVAPVRIGKCATIGAGSVIHKDAPENKLTIARATQVTIESWQPRRKRN